MGGRGANFSLISKNLSDAVEYYVSGDGMWINQYLREKGDFGELSNEEKDFLNDLSQVTNDTINEKTLYRSVDASSIFGDMSTSDFIDMESEIVNQYFSKSKGSYSQQIAKKYNDKVKSLIGKTITEKGFMSTTTNYNTANNWNGFTGQTKKLY